MRRLPLIAIACLSLAACGGKLPKSVDEAALDRGVGQTIGDDFTCVVLVEKGSAKEVWKGGLNQACRNAYPACSHPGEITVRDLAEAAAKGTPVTTGCQSVSWASGPAGKGDYVYGAVMYGKRALPGMEMARRLDAVFSDAGL